MNPSEHFRRMRLTRVLVLLGLSCFGCGRGYLGPELREVSPNDLQVPKARRALNVQVACSPDRPCSELTLIVHEALAPYVSSLPAENVDRLAIQFEERLEMPTAYQAAGRISLLLVQAITLGLIGSTVPHGKWIMAAESLSAGRPPFRREYTASFYSNFGLPFQLVTIPGTPRGARPAALATAPGPPATMRRQVTREMVLNLVRDLQQAGML